jgi:hypothetical protein
MAVKPDAITVCLKKFRLEELFVLIFSLISFYDLSKVNSNGNDMLYYFHENMNCDRDVIKSPTLFLCGAFSTLI